MIELRDAGIAPEGLAEFVAALRAHAERVREWVTPLAEQIDRTARALVGGR